MALEYLSQIEKEKIIRFNEDIVLVNAIRKVLLEVIYNQGILRKETAPDPLRNAALGTVFSTLSGRIVSNEELGADLRALAEGVNLLEQGLLQLGKIKKDQPDEVSSGINEAI